MNLLVCISNVPDTTTKIKFVDGNKTFDSSGVQWIINPWDELALTRAVELKEDAGTPVESVVVVAVGEAITEPTLRKCLAIGADKAVRIDGAPRDAYFTAFQLSNYVNENPYDMIICGIESSDFNSSAVGGMLAEMLDMPSVSSVSGIQFDGGKVVIQRDVATGIDLVETDGPAVLIAQKGFAKVPRIPNMRGIMMARKKPLEVVGTADCDHLIEYSSYELPQPKSAVQMFDVEKMDDLINELKSDLGI